MESAKGYHAMLGKGNTVYLKNSKCHRPALSGNEAENHSPSRRGKTEFPGSETIASPRSWSQVITGLAKYVLDLDNGLTLGTHSTMDP